MKFCVAAAVLLVSLVATTMALPAYKRMALVQQPTLYYQPRAASQRLVYMQQYVQQRPSARTHARFIAADSVAAGSNLDDCVHPVNAASVEQQNVEESVDAGVNEAEAYPAAGGQSSAEFEGTYAEGGVSAAADVQASAEVPASAALPEVPDVPLSAELPDAPAADNQVLEDESYVPSAAAPELPSNDEAKVPREYNFENPADAVPEPAVAPAEEAVPEVPAVPEIPEIPALNPEQAPAEEAIVPEVAASSASGPSPAAAADVPLAAAPSVPAVGPVAVAPPKRYLPPRKKVTVRLDEQSEVASDDDVDVDSYRPARVPNARRPAKGNGNAVGAKGKGQLPVGTFFPINFGGTSGGAIAIANSFSTGEGGSATSHAIAYGSPDVARAKGRPVRRH